MSLLEAVTNVAREAGYAVDTKVVTSNDLTTKQLYAIANRIISEITRRYDWPQLWKSASFTLVDGQGTYPLPGDFSRYHADTFWDSSQRWKVYGPLTTQEYASIRGFGVIPTLFNRFTVRGVSNNNILIDPTPNSSSAGHVIIYEYTSSRPVRPRFWETGMSVTTGSYCFYNGNYYVAEGAGTAGASAPTHTTGSASDGTITWDYYDGDYDEFLADTDEPIFQQRALEQGMLERFASIKGLNFEKMFDTQLEEEYARSRPGKEFSMISRPNSVLTAISGRAVLGRGMVWP